MSQRTYSPPRARARKEPPPKGQRQESPTGTPLVRESLTEKRRAMMMTKSSKSQEEKNPTKRNAGGVAISRLMAGFPGPLKKMKSSENSSLNMDPSGQ